MDKERKEKLKKYLQYWCEPEYVYYPEVMIPWEYDHQVVVCESKRSFGYFPVYETFEEAEQAHPGCDIIEHLVIPADVQ
jgi:hypothetical protein